MDTKNDKPLNLCMLAIFCNSAGIKLDGVEAFLNLNNYNYDKQILEYYMNNVDRMLTNLESELMNVTTSSKGEVKEEKVTEQKKEEVVAEPAVDFSSFF